MVRQTDLLKVCGLLVLEVFVSNHLLHAMEGARGKDAVMIDAEKRHARATSQFVALLDGHELADTYEPYHSFTDLLNVQELRGSAAHMIGLMCKTELGVPEHERSLKQAQKYFSIAAENGNMQAFDELARCARESGHYAQTIDYWRQERFFQMSNECLAQAHQIGTGDVQARDTYIMDTATNAMRFIPLLPSRTKQQRPYVQAVDAFLKALKMPASHGNTRAQCLIARLYMSMPDDGHIAEYVRTWLSPVLNSSSRAELSTLMKSTDAYDALKFVAQTGDVAACRELGIKFYNEHRYDEAYQYCHKAAQKGDQESQCYCIVMQIHGSGVQHSCACAAQEIQELAKTAAGRKSLSMAAQLSTSATLEFF